MIRVYSSLKRRIMEGEFPPGARLDPARLRSDLAASTTPIRDALHRLTGEGLVESWQNEGFRLPHISEPALRDLYAWSCTLIGVALDAAPRRPDLEPVGPPTAARYSDSITATLLQVAALSLNHELRRAVANVCDRGFTLRAIEQQLCSGAQREVDDIDRALAACEWSTARMALAQFHKRRLAIVPDIAARLRERGAQNR